MENEILEYLQYNCNMNRSDKIIESLEEAISKFDSTTPIELKLPIYSALGIAKGWIQYRVKDFAVETGLTRTAVRTQVKQLEMANLITLEKMDTVTFIALNKA